MLRLRLPSGRKERRFKCVRKLENSANWQKVSQDVVDGLRSTNQPNCDAAPQESRILIDGPLNGRGCCRESRPVNVNGQEETGENVIMRRTETNVQKCREVDWNTYSLSEDVHEGHCSVRESVKASKTLSRWSVTEKLETHNSVSSSRFKKCSITSA